MPSIVRNYAPFFARPSPQPHRRATAHFGAVAGTSEHRRVLLHAATYGSGLAWTSGSMDIISECVAQIDRMIDAGISPTHLDSHRHIHAHPAISWAVARAAASRGISHIRAPLEPLRLNAGNWRSTIKKTGLYASAQLSRRPVTTSRRIHFVGISLQGGKYFAERLFALIRACRRERRS